MPFAQLIEGKSLYDRLKVFMNRIFLTKRELALCYQFFDYLLVLPAKNHRDILRRHGRTMRNILDGDAGITELAEQKCTIDRYLSGN